MVAVSLGGRGGDDDDGEGDGRGGWMVQQRGGTRIGRRNITGEINQGRGDDDDGDGNGGWVVT